LGDVVTAVAATLQPGAMLAVPLLSTPLLPCTIPLKAALPCPSPLLLPCDCLLPRTLRRLLLPGLLGTLCLLLPLLLRLLGPLLLRLSFRLLGPLLPRLLFHAPLLLVGPRRSLPSLTLLRFGPSLSILVLVLLRVHRAQGSKKQK